MKKKTLSVILIIVFTAFIAVAGVLYAVLPKADYSSTEKRYLSQMPDVSFKKIKDGSFSADFEKFLSDQTPFRKFFVSVNAYFELAKGNNGSNGVYLGKEGWLIEKPFERDNRFNVNMNRIAAFCGNTDIPVVLVSVPSKGSVYGEYLPGNSMNYHDYDLIEAIPDYLGNSAEVISLTDAFEKSKDEYQLYYRTDHHWTADGAYIAYKQICSRIGLVPTDYSSYSISEYEGFFGTSYSTSCYTLTKPDSVKIFRNEKTDKNVSVTVVEGKKETHSDSMFFDNRLSEDDMYTVYLDGNHSMVDIETGNDGPVLLMIKDSFAHCLAPFLADNYSRIIMIDLRYYKKSVTELAEENSVDQIMFVYGIDSLATSRDIILK